MREARVAAAPISWGVSELRGWGYQMPRERVLDEMRELGFAATESGPPGYLPDDPNARRALLQRYGLRLVAGFLATILHEPSSEGFAPLEREARGLAASGAEVIVVAAAMPAADYDGRQALSEKEWQRLVEALGSVHRLAATYGLTVAIHPHVGTAIQSREEVEKLLATTQTDLCLDTGHLFLGGTDPAELAAGAADRIKHVHLKDVDGRLAADFQAGNLPYGEAVRRGIFRPLGQGDLHVEAVVDRLRHAGYRGWFVLEQDTALTAEPERGSGPVVSARQSLEYFRRISGAGVNVTAGED